MNWTHYLLLVGAYWVGAIPFGVLVAKRYGVDILSVGSKNPGATNVWRTLGKGPGSIVFAMDVLKGYVPAAIGLILLKDNYVALAAGMVAMLGHSFSPFIRFKGGKGIATGLGMLLGSTPLVAVSALGVFVVLVAATRYISFGSVVAAASMSVFGWAYGEPLPIILALAFMGCFVVIRHKANIARLAKGSEPKFSFSQAGKASSPEKAVVEDERASPELSRCAEPHEQPKV